MTDLQLVNGILQNDERAWRYICMSMKTSFMSKVRVNNLHGNLTPSDLEDIFQESCITIMQKIKSGNFVNMYENGLFNYLVKVGNGAAKNLIRKNGRLSYKESLPEPDEKNEKKNHQRSDAEKQKLQHEFLDRIYHSMPSDCQKIFKLFYWDHKPMDDIASITGMKNADSVITKKSKCMKKFSDIGKLLVAKDEFSEEDVRNTVERAALRALLEEERTNLGEGFRMAAYDTDDDAK